MFEQAVYALVMLWNTGEIVRDDRPMTRIECAELAETVKGVQLDDGSVVSVIAATCVFELGA